jgi:DNA-binding transcriptional regulator YhcF (GntR family)
MVARHTRSRQLVLRVLLDTAGGKAECWPSNRKIAGIIGLKPRAVQLILRALEDAGAIRCVEDESMVVQRRIVLLGHPGTRDALRREGAQINALRAKVCARKGAGIGAQSSATELVQEENEKESASSVLAGESRPDDAGSDCDPMARRFFGHLPELKSGKNSK